MKQLDNLKEEWEEFGRSDPLYYVLTHDKFRNNRNISQFFLLGEREVKQVIKSLINYSLIPPIKITKDKNKNIKIFNKMIDFGCGVGRLSLPWSRYVKKVYGIDISSEMIKLARKYYHNFSKKEEKIGICEFIINPKDNLGLFDDGEVDFIYSNITLQHIRPIFIRKYLREFIRILKKDGILIFQVPSHEIPDNFFRKIKLIIKSFIPREWLFSIKKTVIKKPILELYGLKKHIVVDLLQKNRCKIIGIKSNKFVGANWMSYTYYCIKL